jgi:hypothetical protein
MISFFFLVPSKICLISLLWPILFWDKNGHQVAQLGPPSGPWAWHLLLFAFWTTISFFPSFIPHLIKCAYLYLFLSSLVGRCQDQCWIGPKARQAHKSNGSDVLRCDLNLSNIKRISLILRMSLKKKFRLEVVYLCLK